MHAIRFGWKLKTLLTLALPLLLAITGCEEDDSEGEGDSDAAMMAVEVEVCIAPGESDGAEVSEPADHAEPAVDGAEQVAVSGSGSDD